MRPRLTALIFVVPAILAIVGCGLFGDDRPKSALVRIAISSNPQSLDPAYNTDFNGGVVAAKIFNGLVRFEGDRIVGDLADTWSIADGREYRFRLREGVFFHDGSPLNASAAAQSFLRVMDERIASPRRWVFDAVDTIFAASDLDLVVRLSKPVPSFLSKLTMPAGYVIRLADVAEKNPAIVGSGPYKLERWEEGAEIVLARNGGYFGGAPGVDGISFPIVSEPMTALSLFRGGELHVFDVPSAQVGSFQGDIAGMGEIQSAPELAVVYVAVNCDRFKDRRVRRALGLAVDRERIIHDLLGGLGEPAGGPVPPALGGSGRRPEYAPAEAKKLLADAGVDLSKPIVLLRSSKATAHEPTEAIAGYLRDVGFKVSIEPMEMTSLRERTNRADFDLAYYNWYGDYPDPENFLEPLFHSSNLGGAGNRARFRNPAADAAIEAVESTVDPVARAEAVSRAEEIVRDESPWIFLWYPKAVVAVSNKLAGYRYPAIFNADKGTGYQLRDRE